MKRTMGELGIVLVAVTVAIIILTFVLGDKDNSLLGKENLGSVAPAQTTQGNTSFESINKLYDRAEPVITFANHKLEKDGTYDLCGLNVVSSVLDADGNDIKEQLEIKKVVFSKTMDKLESEDVVLDLERYDLTSFCPDTVMKDVTGDANANGKGIFQISYFVKDSFGISKSVSVNVVVN